MYNGQINFNFKLVAYDFLFFLSVLIWLVFFFFLKKVHDSLNKTFLKQKKIK